MKWKKSRLNTSYAYKVKIIRLIKRENVKNSVSSNNIVKYVLEYREKVN